MQRMFSSSANNIIHNPFALFPSSCAPPLQPIITNHDYNEIFLQHHHDLLPAAAASSLLPAANPQFTESLVNMALLNNATMCKQDGGGVGLHGECNFGANPGFVIPVIKKPVKKDRHSKICTAQGVRDRRVRLSIEIAREFFDLQDMLGFDKASKTLEWLLRNSRNAIKELEMMKHGNGCQGSLSSSPECEMVAENIGDELDDRGDRLEGTSPKSKSAEGLVCKEKKMKKLQKATVHVLAKESRAKARARARERTREKMCNRSSSTHLLKRSSCPDTSPQFLNNVRSLAQLEASKKPANTYDQNMASSFKVVSGGAHQVDDPCPGGRRRQLSTSAARNNNVIEESIVIRRKLKPSTILGSQQINLAAAKDISCSSSSGNNNYFPNLSQNWDMNGAMAHSAFCAITNMNLSTGVQIYGKP